MDVALARAVLEERRGSPLVELVPSTLGEPLLWPGLPAVAEVAAAQGVLLNVTTNGTWPGRGAAAWAEALLPMSRDVKLSWNGATAATAAAIMPGLDLVRAIDDLRAVLAVRDRLAAAGGRRCTISLQVTAQERNVGELADIVALAAELGVDRVKLNHLQLRGLARAEETLRASAAGVGRWNAAVAAAREAAAGSAGRRAVVLENALPLPLDPGDRASGGACPFAGREAWIHPDGRLAPCPHPAAEAGALGEFGSVATTPLGALWSAAPFRVFVARHLEEPVCQGCALRRPGGA
jgi:MoaA/NifB/PqqE/SkfB family radical SAM enzyme